jgi:hypothetical protein
MEEIFEKPILMIVAQSKDFSDPHIRVVIGKNENGSFKGLHNIKTLEDYETIKKTYTDINLLVFTWAYAKFIDDIYLIF